MRNTKEIHNGMDIIDSRDIIARIEYLQSNKDDLQFSVDNAEDADQKETAINALAEWEDSDEGQELKTLTKLADEANSSPDWQYGETLIRDNYFESYAQELAEDIGAINKDARWPNDHIDWAAAAEALQMDYFSVEFGDTTYWIRG